MKVGKLLGENVSEGDEDEIDVCREARLVAPKKLAQQTFGAVALNGPAETFGSDEAGPRRTYVGVGADQQQEAASAHARARMVLQTDEICPFLQAFSAREAHGLAQFGKQSLTSGKRPEPGACDPCGDAR